MYENKENLNIENKETTYFLQSKNGIAYTKVYIKVNENYSSKEKTKNRRLQPERYMTFALKLV